MEQSQLAFVMECPTSEGRPAVWAPDVSEQLSQIVGKFNESQAEPREVRVDLADAKDASSAELGRLITIHRKLAIENVRMVLCNVPPALRELFAITKLDRILKIE